MYHVGVLGAPTDHTYDQNYGRNYIHEARYKPIETQPQSSKKFSKILRHSCQAAPAGLQLASLLPEPLRILGLQDHTQLLEHLSTHTHTHTRALCCCPCPSLALLDVSPGLS